MIVYVAGPMRGYPLYNFNAFFAAAMWLREQGFIVLNPAEHDMARGFDPSKGLNEQTNDFSLHEAFQWDLKSVSEADAIVLLEGWQNSRGACTELAAAISTGKRAYELRDVQISSTSSFLGLHELDVSDYTIDFETQNTKEAVQ